MIKKNTQHDDPEQSKRFIDAAKEAEADETEGGADRAFSKIAKPRNSLHRHKTTKTSNPRNDQ